MADIFDEVNEDLRAERARQFAKRYGGVLAVLAVLLVAGIAGWQGWRWYQARLSGEVAGTYMAAARAAGGIVAADETTPGRTEAQAEFARVAATGPEGYRTLARLRAASLRANAGDLTGALALWDQVAADAQADTLLRDLASLLWAQHQVDAGDPAVVEARLVPLANPNNPWRPLALESQAWLALRTGKPDKARETLRILSADPTAPDGVRGRAGGLLTRLGETPAAGAGAAGTGG